MNIDFGFTHTKRGGWTGTKVTLNYWNNVWYLHIREYIFDGDSGRWFPTKTGITMPAENIDTAAELLSNAGKKYAEIVRDDLKNNPQLDFFDKLDGE